VIIGVRLTNRIAYLPPLDEATHKKLRDCWSFSPKGLWMMPKYQPTKILRSQRAETLKQIERMKAAGDVLRVEHLTELVAEVDKKLEKMWDGKISMIDRGRVSAGLFRATWRDVEAACGVKFTVKQDRQTLEFVQGLPLAGEQYRHQNDCVGTMLTTVPRGGGIILAATSSGKTAIAARLFAKTKCGCLFVVDQLDLLYQQRAEIAEWTHETVGIVGDSEFQPGRITVATIQTLHKHSSRKAFQQWFSGIDIMVVDELHEALAKRNFSVLQSIKPVAIFGLTATLQLGQKETRTKAYAFAGPVIFRFPIVEGVERKVLSKGYALQLLFAPQPVQKGTDYRGELAIQVTQNDVKLGACEKLSRMLVGMDRHVVVLVDRLTHLHDVDDVLADVPHGLAYGAVKVAERQQARELFEDDDIKLIIANKVFKKGISIKRIDAMIDMAEGKSKNDAVQKYGRGLRLHKDKTELIYIDFGTSGHGRFAKAAVSRRRALQAAGIGVTTARVSSEAQAISAVRKFIGKVSACHNSKNLP
jgi:superfamily II DNA or RNA helicase